MYTWRRLTDEQRMEALDYRRLQRFPKHSPPHFEVEGSSRFLITAACYEHRHVIGTTTSRMSEFTSQLLSSIEPYTEALYAWCVLPNHYHILPRTSDIAGLRSALGKLHGRTSYTWNGEDGHRGRQVWHNCFERQMRSERHFFASLNYVLNNAVHHGYAERWQDWPWSNATEYLELVGKERAADIWRSYPVLDYGSKWDMY